MPSVKRFASRVFIGAVASVSFVSLAHAAGDLVLGDFGSFPIQTRLNGATSFGYHPTGDQTSQLKIYVDSFLFCANNSSNTPDDPPPYTNMTFITAYEDQSLAPVPHPWTFPSALDINSFGYSAGNLTVAPGSIGRTLACQDTSSISEVPSALRDGIFDNGLESQRATDYGHLINFNPPAGFDWEAPNWASIAADACGFTAFRQASVPENTACAAATGVGASGLRGATMLTGSDGVTFTYVFRVDARLGAPTGQQDESHSPQPVTDALQGTGAVYVNVVDAFDSAFLGSDASYCFPSVAPTAADVNVCNNLTTYPLSGPLNYQFAVSSTPGFVDASGFYVAINRSIRSGGSHTSTTTPAVAAAILVDQGSILEGADQFSGDDIVFGFTARGSFPWMNPPQ